MKLLDKIRAHPAVAECHDETEFGGGYFINLKPGWEWSEQRCFGVEYLREAWSLLKAARKVD